MLFCTTLRVLAPFALYAMARLGRNGFLAIAVVFHLIYIWSIFDTYFVSPIVHGMREHAVPSEKAPAKRLVLFVGKTMLNRTLPYNIEYTNHWNAYR